MGLWVGGGALGSGKAGQGLGVAELKPLAQGHWQNLLLLLAQGPEGGFPHSWHGLFCVLHPERDGNHPGAEQTGPRGQLAQSPQPTDGENKAPG